jgi:hypothetical protein
MTTATDDLSWTDTNQQALIAALADVGAALKRHSARGADAATASSSPGLPQSAEGALESAPPALEQLSTTFGLSSFERAVILLCAGVELDAELAGLCAAAQGDPARPYPTFSLALAALPGAHWSALTPAGPLRRWRLIEVVSQPSAPLVTSPLRIDERILHFLTGIQYLDERLVGLVESVPPGGDLVFSHREIARQVARAWSRAQGTLPLVELWGADEAIQREIAAAACAELELRLCALAAETVPVAASELEGLLRLWQREAALTSSALYVEASAVDLADTRAVAVIARLLDGIRGAVILGARDRWRPLRRPMLTLEVRKPTGPEQCTTWATLLGDAESANGNAHHLAAQFNLSVPAIRASVQDARARETEGEALAARLWDASRARARPRLDNLAQRIEPVATWDDLVLPPPEKNLLKEIAAHVAHRSTVYERWGFGATSQRGLGLHALFAGASGTGKTMAAEVMAGALRLDLYRIDLASVVSKYIGETEKNLRRVFDAAEDGGAILFFDEADALFGKRSEVKDSHDRYANVEISYLLQRMEAYRGLAVLATNRKGDLDPAFLRRIRFVVNFPFPDAAHRLEIWQRIFPGRTPTEGLDFHKLARLDVAGGNIRNMALGAAFLAADAGEPVRMRHLARAARSEYAKIEKPLTDAELGGWS